MITTGSSPSIGLEKTRRRIARWRETRRYRGPRLGSTENAVVCQRSEHVS